MFGHEASDAIAITSQAAYDRLAKVRTSCASKLTVEQKALSALRSTLMADGRILRAHLGYGGGGGGGGGGTGSDVSELALILAGGSASSKKKKSRPPLSPQQLRLIDTASTLATVGSIGASSSSGLMTMAELLNQSFRGDGSSSVTARREKIMAALKGQYEEEEDDDGEMAGFLGKINERVRENLERRGRKVAKAKPKLKPKASTAMGTAKPFMVDGDLTQGLEDFEEQVSLVTEAANSVFRLELEHESLERVLSAWDRLNNGFISGPLTVVRKDDEKMLSAAGRLVGALSKVCGGEMFEPFMQHLFLLPSATGEGVVRAMDDSMARSLVATVKKRVDALVSLRLPIEGTVVAVLCALVDKGGGVSTKAMNVADVVLNAESSRVSRGERDMCVLGEAVQRAIRGDSIRGEF